MFGSKKEPSSAVGILSEKTCAPCAGGTRPIDGEQLDEMLALCPGWHTTDGNKITKEYKFADWKGAADFCYRVADLAEQEGHHPDIHLYYGKVVIECSTHKVKGLSENDFILAAKIDRMQEGADLE